MKKLKLINKVVDESQPNNIKNNLLEIVKELDTDYFESSAESNINSLLNSCSDMTLVIEVFLNNWLKDQTFFPQFDFKIGTTEEGEIVNISLAVVELN